MSIEENEKEIVYPPIELRGEAVFEIPLAHWEFAVKDKNGEYLRLPIDRLIIDINPDSMVTAKATFLCKTTRDFEDIGKCTDFVISATRSDDADNPNKCYFELNRVVPEAEKEYLAKAV